MQFAQRAAQLYELNGWCITPQSMQVTGAVSADSALGAADVAVAYCKAALHMDLSANQQATDENSWGKWLPILSQCSKNCTFFSSHAKDQ